MNDYQEQLNDDDILQYFVQGDETDYPTYLEVSEAISEMCTDN